MNNIIDFPKNKKVQQEPDILWYWHCSDCLTELPSIYPPVSPAEYASLSIGPTKTGFQVWCVRHNKNVANIHITEPTEFL